MGPLIDQAHDQPPTGEVTNRLAAVFLRSLFGSGRPRALYLGLSVCRPGPSLSAWPIEPTDPAYHRIRVVNSPEFFRVREDWIASVRLNFPIAWPVPGEDWGRVRELVIFDAPHGGNLVAFSKVNRRGWLEVLEGVPLPVTPPGHYRLGLWSP